MTHKVRHKWGSLPKLGLAASRPAGVASAPSVWRSPRLHLHVRLSGSLPDRATLPRCGDPATADARGHRQSVGPRWLAKLLRLGGRAARPGRGPCGSSAGPGEGPLCGCSWQDGAGGGGEEAAAGPQWASGGGRRRPNQ